MNHQDKKHFCLMPFLHVHIDATGMTKACCVSTINLGKIKNSSISEIWQSDEIQNLRRKFLNNEADNRCQNCYLKEASGSESLRTETLKKFGHLAEKVTKNPEPLYFDIRFSNSCNLKCRTCWHGNSSKWFEDAKKLKRNIGDKALIKAFESTDIAKEELQNYFKSAVEFYFAGGEPLMMEEHLMVLDGLTNAGNFDCLLRYNTNLSSLHQFNQDLVEKWKPFKNIEVLASLDGLGEKGEMIRSGIDLKNFEENFRKLKKLDNIKIKLAPTLSVLNADILPELHKTYFEKDLISIDDIHFNILHQPFFYNVKAFKTDKKVKIESLFREHIEWIKKQNGNPMDWKNATDYMMSEDLSNRFEKTKYETGVLNELREEEFRLE